MPCRISGSASGRSELVCGFSRHQERVSPDAHSWMVTSVFCAAGSRIRSWLHGKNDRPKTSCSRLLDLSCPNNTSSGVLVGDVLLLGCLGSLHALGEVLIFLSLFAVTTPHHRCSVANMAYNPLASDGLMLTMLVF